MEIQCSQWATKMIEQLRNQNNIGVVGPVDRGRNLLTQAMVHRTHFQIFNQMYPPVFKNWYMDDWMELVYGSFTAPIEECFVENSRLPPRYQIQTRAFEFLRVELPKGCFQIQIYLRANDIPYWETFECTSVSPLLADESKSATLRPGRYKLTDQVPVKLESSPLKDAVQQYVNTTTNIILITFTNFAQVNMTDNWLVFVNFWKIQEYLVICLDAQAFDYYTKKGIHCYYDESHSSKSEFAGYLENHYKQLVNLKTFYNFQILSLGFNTLLSDNDVIFLQNPFKFLKLPGTQPSSHPSSRIPDIQIQDDSNQLEECRSVNTGFQLVVSSIKTVSFYHQVYMLTQSSDMQDQRAYNFILFKSFWGKLLNWQVLDGFLFPNGWLYFIEKYNELKNINPVVIHNNWLRGYSSKVFFFSFPPFFTSTPLNSYKSLLF